MQRTETWPLAPASSIGMVPGSGAGAGATTNRQAMQSVVGIGDRAHLCSLHRANMRARVQCEVSASRGARLMLTDCMQQYGGGRGARIGYDYGGWCGVRPLQLSRMLRM